MGQPSSATMFCCLYLFSTSEGKLIRSKSFLRFCIHLSHGLPDFLFLFLEIQFNACLTIWSFSILSMCAYHITLLQLIIVSNISSPVRFLASLFVSFSVVETPSKTSLRHSTFQYWFIHTTVTTLVFKIKCCNKVHFTPCS